jgi:hypothetical protein
VARSGERYGGGGAVWIFMMQRGSTAQINATVCNVAHVRTLVKESRCAERAVSLQFENNIGLFEHSLGGGLMVNYMHGGDLYVRGRYVNNSASDGGAIVCSSSRPHIRCGAL